MNMRPLIVEFTGTPEAGKTSSISQLIPLLTEHYNLKISYIRESAEISPENIPKGSFDANLWMVATTVTKLLEQIYDFSNDIVIVDRGIIDGQFFGYKFNRESHCSDDELKFHNNFTGDTKLLPDLLIHLKTTPEEAIHRRGGEGRLVTLKWIENYNNLFEEFISSKSITPFTLDTTGISQEEIVNLIAKTIVSCYEDFKNQA